MAPTAERFLPVYPGVRSKTVLLKITGSGININLVMKLVQGITSFELHNNNRRRYDTRYEPCTVHKTCWGGPPSFASRHSRTASYKIAINSSHGKL